MSGEPRQRCNPLLRRRTGVPHPLVQLGDLGHVAGAGERVVQLGDRHRFDSTSPPESAASTPRCPASSGWPSRARISPRGRSAPWPVGELGRPRTGRPPTGPRARRPGRPTARAPLRCSRRACAHRRSGDQSNVRIEAPDPASPALANNSSWIEINSLVGDDPSELAVAQNRPWRPAPGEISPDAGSQTRDGSAYERSRSTAGYCRGPAVS